MKGRKHMKKESTEQTEYIQSLLDEIEKLEKEEEEYNKRKEEELREEVRRKLYIDGTGEKNHILYSKEILKEWEHTYFTQKRENVEKIANATLSEENMKTIQLKLREYEYRFHGKIPVNIVACCNTIISTKEGPALALSDPYRSIITEPLKIANDEAAVFAGNTLLLDMELRKDCKKYYVKRVRILKPICKGFEHMDKE